MKARQQLTQTGAGYEGIDGESSGHLVSEGLSDQLDFWMRELEGRVIRRRRQE